MNWSRSKNEKREKREIRWQLLALLSNIYKKKKKRKKTKTKKRKNEKERERERTWLCLQLDLFDTYVNEKKIRVQLLHRSCIFDFNRFFLSLSLSLSCSKRTEKKSKAKNVYWLNQKRIFRKNQSRWIQNFVHKKHC